MSSLGVGRIDVDEEGGKVWEFEIAWFGDEEKG